MPYGVTDEQWAKIRQLAEQLREREKQQKQQQQNTVTVTTPTPTTSNIPSTPSTPSTPSRQITAYTPSSGSTSGSTSTVTNPYAWMKEKAVPTAYINPTTGNVMVTAGGGDMTLPQLIDRDKLITQGYVPVTDPNIVSRLQQQALDTFKFNDVSQWEQMFGQNASMVQPLSQAEIEAARQRLAQYQAYQSQAWGTSGGATTTGTSGGATTSGTGTLGLTSAGTGSATSLIQQLNEARLQQQLAALQAAMTRALSGLESTYTGRQSALEREKSASQANLETALQRTLEQIANEEAKINPLYYNLRNQAAAASDVAALNFAQYMASRGVQGSAAGMPEIYRNAALQGQIGALNQQQAADLATIERARSTAQGQYESNLANVLNRYETDLALLEQEYLKAQEAIKEAYSQDMLAARSGISAEGLQAIIDQLNADRLFSLQEAQLTGRYGDQMTLAAQQQQYNQLLQALQMQLAAQQQAFNQAVTEAGLTGYYGGQPTLAGQQALDQYYRNLASTLAQANYENIQAYINTLEPNNPLIPYLQAERQKKIQAQAEQAAVVAAAASEAEKQRYQNALNLWKTYGTATEEIASILGVPVGARTADYDIQKLEAAIAQQKAQTEAQKAKSEAEKSQQQAEKSQQQASQQKVNTYAQQIEKLYVTNQYDENGRVIGKTFNPTLVRAYIQNLHTTGQINDDEAKQLLTLFNFTF